jgi:hypothetical protein
MIRVYRVKKPSNTQDTNFFNSITDQNPQLLSGSLDPSPVRLPSDSIYYEKHAILEDDVISTA